ncbi:MAG: SWIM zinc finger family protein, partial [Lachnospiraceae bacterium]|nr:SWIM zinc finger family protein [Lachnospiraceae bacterium]
MVWKDKFSDATLQMGRNYYEQGMVDELQKTQKGFEAKVGGRRHNVKIGVNRDRVTSLYCDCPESKSRAWCSHVAAVLYAVEEIGEENIPTERIASPRRTEDEDGASGEAAYAYFQTDSLRESLDFSDYLFERGQDLIDGGRIRLRSFRAEYTFLERNMIGVATADAQVENRMAMVQLICGPEKVMLRRCDCPGCSPSFNSRIGDQPRCAHLAALFLLMENEMKREDVGDATDRDGNELIRAFRARRARERMAVSCSGRREQTRALEPRLRNKDGELQGELR